MLSVLNIGNYQKNLELIYTTFVDGISTATTATVLTNLTAYTLRVTVVNYIGSGSSNNVSCTPTA